MKLLKKCISTILEPNRDMFVEIMYVLPNKVSTMLASSYLGCNAEKKVVVTMRSPR